MPRNFRLGYNSDEPRHCRCQTGADAHREHAKPHRGAGLHGDPRCPHSTLHADTVKYPAMNRAQAVREARKRQREASRKRPIRRTVI